MSVDYIYDKKLSNEPLAVSWHSRPVVRRLVHYRMEFRYYPFKGNGFLIFLYDAQFFLNWKYFQNPLLPPHFLHGLFFYIILLFLSISFNRLEFCSNRLRFATVYDHSVIKQTNITITVYNYNYKNIIYSITVEETVYMISKTIFYFST